MKSKIESPAAISLGIHFTFFVIYMAGLSAFGSFVNDMYLPSLPSMTKFFHCSASVVQLGLTTGMIGLALGQLILGPISDKYGRKPVLILSMILFTIAAIVSIFSPTINFFLICRLFQGFGASAGYFLARTIPADVYEGRPLAKTMAIIGAINGFAPASAPVIGGLIAVKWDWQGAFVVLAIFSIILLLFSPKLKETLPPSKRDNGSLLHAFGRYGTLLRNRKFMTHVLLKGASLGILFAYISGAPFIYQDEFGFSKLGFVGIMGANALAVAAGAMIALRFKVLKRAALAGSIGVMICAIILAIFIFTLHNLWSFEVFILPLLFCLGMNFTVSNTLSMNEGRSDAGGASAILGIGGYLFGAVVSPLVGKGDIMHSTAIVILTVAFITLIFAYFSSRLAPDPNMVATKENADAENAGHSNSSK